MKYTITRLCGGEAMLLIPRDVKINLNLETVATNLSSQGMEVHFDDMMIIIKWMKMDVTLYESGKIMFHPLKDDRAGIAYANEIMDMIV